MAQIDTKRLDAGDSFPEITLQFADGATRAFPQRTADAYTVLLVYRGVW